MAEITNEDQTTINEIARLALANCPFCPSEIAEILDVSDEEMARIRKLLTDWSNKVFG